MTEKFNIVNNRVFMKADTVILTQNRIETPDVFHFRLFRVGLVNPVVVGDENVMSEKFNVHVTIVNNRIFMKAEA